MTDNTPSPDVFGLPSCCTTKITGAQPAEILLQWNEEPPEKTSEFLVNNESLAIIDYETA